MDSERCALVVWYLGLLARFLGGAFTFGLGAGGWIGMAAFGRTGSGTSALGGLWLDSTPSYQHTGNYNGR